MRVSPAPHNEADRLAALCSLKILDTPQEAAFDAIVDCASAALDVPIALVSLVDDDRQWFKARVGLDASETPRDVSFCAHVLHGDHVLAVPDARVDPRFADNPLVTGPPFVCAYLGAPLLSPSGHCIGTVCAIDHRPREWTQKDAAQLRRFSTLATELLRQRDRADASDAARSEIASLSARVLRDESLLAQVSAVAGVGGWELDLRAMALTWTRETRRIHKVPDDFAPDLASAVDFYAPEARDTIANLVDRATKTGEGWDVELPLITADGAKIWVRASGEALFEGGAPVKLIGVFQDITDLRAARIARDLDARIAGVIAEAYAALLKGSKSKPLTLAVDGLIRLTGSSAGLLTELVPTAERTLRVRVARNAGWTAGRRRSINQRAARGYLIETSAPFTNAHCGPATWTTPRSGLLPELPAAGTGMVAPLRVGDDLLGYVHLANAPDGYDDAMLAALRPLFDAIAQLILALREREARERSDVALGEALARADQALCDLSIYQAALDRQGPVGIIETDGRFSFVNDQFCKTYNYSRDELVGMRARDLNSGEHSDQFFEDLSAQINAGHPWRGEICSRTRTGAPVWVDVTIVPVLDDGGSVLRHVIIGYDISERRAADRKLRAALDQIAGFFDISLDILCVCDLHGKFIQVNEAFETTLGLPRDSLIGQFFLSYVHPDDREATRAAASRVAQGEVVSIINRYRRADGSYRHLEWRSTSANGVAYGAARDITERMAHEAVLENARVQAESANRAKSAFLANMSHEIRTPLNGVVGVVGALALTKLTKRQRDMVELIRQSGETLDHILGDILDLSKIEAGKIDLCPAPFVLRDVVDTAVALHRVAAAEKGLAFTLTFDPGASGAFLGDAGRLRQIVSNLASNAVKFTETGDIGITVSVDDAAIPPVVTIAVRDTGIGFSEGAAQRLFARFEQADASITRGYGGSGLGLSICRALTAMMGGAITARSQPGAGSVFTVTIPLARTDAALCAPGPSAQSASAPHNLRVLLAEDHPTNQRVVSLILDAFGFDLSFASNGKEALAAYHAARFDLILMDMQMPVMDGLAATRAIRAAEAQNGWSRTPIAMLSANAMPDHIRAASAAGCDTHIAKPFTPQGLIAGIEAAMAAANAPPAPLKGEAAG